MRPEQSIESIVFTIAMLFIVLAAITSITALAVLRHRLRGTRWINCVCDRRQAPVHLMCPGCPRRFAAQERDLECWRLVLELRDEEASAVEIVADNADFNGRNNCLVVCCGGWTEYEDRDFEGATLLEALRAAVEAKRSVCEAEV